MFSVQFFFTYVARAARAVCRSMILIQTWAEGDGMVFKTRRVLQVGGLMGRPCWVGRAPLCVCTVKLTDWFVRTVIVCLVVSVGLVGLSI